MFVIRICQTHLYNLNILFMYKIRVNNYYYKIICALMMAITSMELSSLHASNFCQLNQFSLLELSSADMFIQINGKYSSSSCLAILHNLEL